MSKAISAITLYFCLLFLITFLLPVDSGEPINTDIQDIDPGSISSSAWDIGDNFSIFLSFFSFSLINPLGMPDEVTYVISLFNLFMSIMLIYAIIIAIRGGGGI